MTVCVAAIAAVALYLTGRLGGLLHLTWRLWCSKNGT